MFHCHVWLPDGIETSPFLPENTLIFMNMLDFCMDELCGLLPQVRIRMDDVLEKMTLRWFVHMCPNKKLRLTNNNSLCHTMSWWSGDFWCIYLWDTLQWAWFAGKKTYHIGDVSHYTIQNLHFFRGFAIVMPPCLHVWMISWRHFIHQLPSGNQTWQCKIPCKWRFQYEDHLWMVNHLWMVHFPASHVWLLKGIHQFKFTKMPTARATPQTLRPPGTGRLFPSSVFNKTEETTWQVTNDLDGINGRSLQETIDWRYVP